MMDKQQFRYFMDALYLETLLLENPSLRQKQRPVWPAAWRVSLVTWFARLFGVKIEIRYTRLV